MFIIEMWLFELIFFLVCKSDMSRYGYLEVFQRYPWTSITRVDCTSDYSQHSLVMLALPGNISVVTVYNC